jgi:uncharacterized membrane protein
MAHDGSWLDLLHPRLVLSLSLGSGYVVKGASMSTTELTLGKRLHKLLVPVPELKPPLSPALLKREEERAKASQNRVADGITTFAGSMLFVYIHIIWFGCWIGFGVEAYPYGLLTMIVSLEAIFLSTFVMISQNRADARRQVIADEQWKMVQQEDKQNLELLKLSKQILEVTTDVRALADSFTDRKEIVALTKEVRSLAGSLTDRNAEH